MQVDGDAATALESLMREHEAVLVREGDQPVGVLTRTNVVTLLRLALGHGLGRRPRHPVVLRMIGPAGAGKTTLLIRTLPRLRHCEAAVVMTDEAPSPAAPEERLGGAPVVHEPRAGWRMSLYGWIEQLAEAQLVLIEDTGALPYLGGAAMDDILVLVVPAGLEGEIAEGALHHTAGVVLTRLDSAPAGFDLAAARDRLRSVNPHLAVFGTAASRDDRGLDEWADWIEQRVLPYRY
jgi:Ni2+-binding GTPase involved in maturation of urease and hydrogenase